MAQPAAFMTSVKMSAPGYNKFDLSHDVKLSCRMGQLVPIMALDVVPGDRFNIGCESMVRFAPMLAPIMHRVDITMHYFFVPNRILWENWKNYITNTPVAGNLPAHPHVEITEGNWNALADYMGIPNPLESGADIPELVNALPFAAYQRVWFEYYRDQNIQDPTVVDPPMLADGLNNYLSWDDLRYRCWEHDYFTSCLPFAQKGQPVTIPLDFEGQDIPVNRNVAGGGTSDWNVNPSGVAEVFNVVSADPSIPQEHLYANLDPVTATSTINDLRTAYRLQEWLEKAARGGSRYIENTLAFFGVHSSDKRLQRPEYITGIKSPVMISEVLNTTGTVDAPQGNMAGHGIGVVNGKYGSYYAEEHGWIIGVMSVMPKTAYQNGIPKKFLRINTPFEYYWPQFAHLGEQAVSMKEIFAFAADNDQTFGYLPAYSEYKYESNRVAGDFRDTLDFWHMGRKFTGQPLLNDDFISANPFSMAQAGDRVFAVQDPAVDYLWCHVYNKISALRKMPVFGTPTF